MIGVAVRIDGERHRGWTEARVVRSLEQAAGTFRVAFTDRDPGRVSPRALRPGARAAVALGGDQVIAGWIDSVRVRYDAESHAIELAGRDAVGDLVDCSAASQPGEWRDARLEDVAASLARPYGIEVVVGADTGAPFRRFRIEEGETVYEAVERGCRMRKLLPLSDGAGRLVLGRPGGARAGVALRRGDNILSAAGESDWSGRYNTYRVLGQRPGLGFLGADAAAHVRAVATDPTVTRYRPLTLLAEQALDDEEAVERARWEADVRAARARRVTVQVRGWREGGDDGPLWTPGGLVHVADDLLGLDRDLLIAAVACELSEEGTRATLSLAPPEAFSGRLEPEPEPEGWGWIP